MNPLNERIVTDTTMYRPGPPDWRAHVVPPGGSYTPPPAPTMTRIQRLPDGSYLWSAPPGGRGVSNGQFPSTAVPDMTGSINGGMSMAMGILNQFLPFMLTLLGIMLGIGLVRRVLGGITK